MQHNFRAANFKGLQTKHEKLSFETNRLTDLQLNISGPGHPNISISSFVPWQLTFTHFSGQKENNSTTTLPSNFAQQHCRRAKLLVLFLFHLSSFLVFLITTYIQTELWEGNEGHECSKPPNS